MRRLNDLTSVGAKLLWIVAIISATTTIGLATVAGAMLYREQRDQRAEIVQSQAQVVAMNSGAALAFGDREMAYAALASLQRMEGIQRASLRDRAGNLVASWVAPQAPMVEPPPRPPGLWPVPGGQALVLPVEDQAGVHGHLQVEYRDGGPWPLVLRLLLQAAVLFALTMLLAWWLARRLHPVLTAPVQELERATRQVRETGDYGIRANRISDDELGRLADDFNGMLERIGASQRELQRAQRNAEEASRLKDEFVATVSHELRTPLSPIVAWLQLLRMPGGAAQLPKALDVMERNARALTLIINDLLDMSRIVSGTMRLELRPVPIDAPVRAAVETVQPAAQARHIALVVELDEPAPVVRGDAARLQQVVWNLLSNAVKFTEPGGRIVVRGHADGEQVVLEVADSGQGIAAEFLPFVFDRFRQQDGSITRSHGGLGLGLAIVRQLVELHGGSVDARSAGLGKGATFRVSLPRAPAAVVSTAEAAAATALPALAATVVLAVEDDADMLQVVDSILREAGARVLVAIDADEALARVADERPDVIVSDIGLPGVDGYQLLGQLRALIGAVPAVALTAYASAAERDRAFAAGYQAHVAKPFEPAQLVAAVGRTVHGDRA
ncbi:ATP-binding protein [Arenimonas composti]|uniref:histidine kinase n=1 Tax=Arenimonas composti TR7-09 = DSM 18010 TaxID=1121013 RepID=A0A091BD93_9GAMM|nr:ATP-binding protein [Arenimonas composti]KFN50653.1 hypothetical protein P873_05695 [Arenimonas composti TR7-09 = DSM 18010]